MIKNVFKVAVTSLMMLTIVACNNNEGAFDTNNRDVSMGEDPLVSISSLDTNTSSGKYPHTKAVKVQEAKYKFVKVNMNQQDQQKLVNRLTTRYQNQMNQSQQQKQTPAQNQAQKATEQPGTTNTTQKQAQPQQQPEAQPQQQQQAQPQQQKETGAGQAKGEGLSEIESQVIELTNKERRANGLPDLKADTSLSNVAGEKSDDMQKNNYFSHTSPTYGSPFDMMRDFGIAYNTAGENIAQGQRSAEEVVNAWMNSEGHRKNILSDKFTHIGVGHTVEGNHWTQMFIGK